VLDLNDFFLLVQVVDRGGFTAAGRTLRMPKSTLSHRIQQLETSLGVRLLNRTSRRFGMTDAGQEFYRHAVAMLREAEQAETAIRHRLREPTGIVRCTAGVATMQFAMREIVADFLVRYPKVMSSRTRPTSMLTLSARITTSP
jgi:DNA-binding transcriptional LysR family regulator